MKKTELNEKLRGFARTLSPTEEEQILISKIYDSFNELLGKNNCIQVGSYPRKTSVTRVHDLDILYFLGAWSELEHTPQSALSEVVRKIKTEYKNPTVYSCSVALQSHSVSIAYFNDSKEVFSVDIVPAYIFSKNEFGEDTYKVPEMIREKQDQRKSYYENLRLTGKEMGWIHSDPRGYIAIASEVGGNADFRKAVKFVKRWKDNLKAHDNTLKLKSFHLEQVITKLFISDPDLTLFDAIFRFFVDFPSEVLVANQISDRVNPDKYIDDYIAKLSTLQKEVILEARDGFLINLENCDERTLISALVEVEFRRRMSGTEEYLFDRKIPVFIEKEIAVIGKIQQKSGERLLAKDGFIDQGQYIRFLLQQGCGADMYMWKVKNDDGAPQRRGEITVGHTQNDPERTAYKGNHYVECFAVENDICVARARQNVRLK